MDMYLWDNYEADEINEKIKYWVDLWEDLIDNFNKRSYGLKLTNPQLLIKDIIDEIESNNFQNNENKKYYYNKLNEILSDDPVIRENYKIEFNLIRKKFNDNRFYVKELCKECQKIFTSGKYYTKAFLKLKKILLNPLWEEKNKENILILTQHIIIDLILKGYSLETVQKFPKKIFDKYYFRSSNYIETKFPCETNIDNYLLSDEYDFERYSKDIQKEIDKLTIEDRLDKLINYYFSEPEEVYFIFLIEGLKGDIDISVGPVNFYSPKIKKYIKNKIIKEKDEELFNQNEKQCFLNAAVKISTLDYCAASHKAIEEIEKALDVLKTFYNTNSRFEIIRENYLVVDMDGREKEESFSVSYEKGIFRWNSSFNLQENQPDGWLNDAINNCGSYIFNCADKQNIAENRIAHSMHWFRKGTEAKSFEDKLVNYWVSIENLLEFKISMQDGVLPKNQKETKFSLANELVTPFIISNYIYDVGWELYWYLRKLMHTSQGDRKCLVLPDNIVKECNLEFIPGATISLNKFITALPNLLAYIDRQIIKEKINYTYKFYSDISFARTQIENYRDNIKDDILMLYRYRNKIVHNAHYDNTILPYYVGKARKYSALICGKVASMYNKESNQVLEELFVNKYIRVNEMIEKLNNNIKIDFLKVKL